MKLAALLGRYEGVGHDLVNHCVNDILTVGAEPLFFLDYIGNCGLSDDAKVALVRGVAEACRDAGCALLGGETADMPGTYDDGDFDLVGAITGVVERDAVIDGSRIEEGDVLIGLPSNGLHTNGYPSSDACSTRAWAATQTMSAGSSSPTTGPRGHPRRCPPRTPPLLPQRHPPHAGT